MLDADPALVFAVVTQVVENRKLPEQFRVDAFQQPFYRHWTDGIWQFAEQMAVGANVPQQVRELSEQVLSRRPAKSP